MQVKKHIELEFCFVKMAEPNISYLSTKHENHQNTSMCFKILKKPSYYCFIIYSSMKKNITGLEWNVTFESFEQTTGKCLKLVISVISLGEEG